MEQNVKYYVVKDKAVPEVLIKVVEAKRLLTADKMMTVKEATDKCGISRSSFYKYKDDIEKEIKLNVTSLTKEKNKYRIEKLVSYSEYTDKNYFSPEKIGTLNHMFLQHIDFKKSYAEDDLKNQLIYLVHNEFITKEESEVINLSRIQDFLGSEFGQRIKNSKTVYKEESFVMNYNGSVLSGTVDLFFEEENHIVLVDYKTDHIPLNEVTKRASYYKSQLDMYKEAIQKAFGKEVRQSYIYFLSLGKYLEVS